MKTKKTHVCRRPADCPFAGAKWFDRGGFILFYKRLERNKFKLPKVGEACVSQKLESTQLAMLLEGIDYNRVRTPIRYHGILAPNAKLRSAIVPQKPDDKELEKTRGKSKNRILWAALLARTFNLQSDAFFFKGMLFLPT